MPFLKNVLKEVASWRILQRCSFNAPSDGGVFVSPSDEGACFSHLLAPVNAASFTHLFVKTLPVQLFISHSYFLCSGLRSSFFACTKLNWTHDLNKPERAQEVCITVCVCVCVWLMVDAVRLLGSTRPWRDNVSLLKRMSDWLNSDFGEMSAHLFMLQLTSRSFDVIMNSKHLGFSSWKTTLTLHLCVDCLIFSNQKSICFFKKKKSLFYYLILFSIFL